jgi:eukaryotic-like serine/threonine-protein kinase
VEPLLPDDPDRIGPNELLARLGAGGMGQVYLARTRGGRPVAVKVIHENLAADRDFRARFGREVAAARRVTGAFTAPLLDADPEATLPWLATAYLPGLSLTDAVERYGPLPVDTVRALGAALAEALAAIHEAGVVHRDLKPPNVLLTSAGPRVIDFGIARAADFATLTGTGVIIGTPGYLAPEQITGAEAGPPVDVFALGALLVHALTGAGPFGRGTSHEMLMRTVGSEPSLDGIGDPVLRAQLAACLDKSPGQRPTPAQLVAAWSSAVPTTPGTALDGTGWLPAPIADEIDRAAAALPRATAPWRVAPTNPPQWNGPSHASRPTQSLVQPPNLAMAPRRRLTRRTLLGGALAVGVLGTAGALFLRERLAGPVRWRVPSEQAWLSDGPWLVDGVLLAEDEQNRFESRSLTDGSLRWTSTVQISDGPLLRGVDGVCVGSPGGIGRGVVGIDLTSGNVLWQQALDTPSSYASAPATGPGRAVVVGRVGHDPVAVYAFGPRDGAQLWKTELAGNIAYGAAVDGGFAYSADEQGYAYGIDTASGVVRWRVRVTEQTEGAYSRPVATGGRLYLADRDILYALDGRTGQPVWNRAIDEGVGESTRPLVADDRIYLPAGDGTLYALNTADGTVAWKAAGSGSPVLAGPVACVSTEDAMVGIALDDGRTLWRRPAAKDDERPLLAGGLFHLANNDGVVSLDPASGTVVRAVGEDDGVIDAHGLDTDGSALYLAVSIGDSALCSLTLPDPPG